MTTKRLFSTLSGTGLLAAVIFSVSSSVYKPVNQGAMDDRSGLNQISIMDTKLDTSKETAQLTPLTAVEPHQEMDSFELIEKKYAQLNPDYARQEVRRIDYEAQKVSSKNYNDFSVEERLTFLNRQREKAVLLNKLILARLERTQK